MIIKIVISNEEKNLTNGRAIIISINNFNKEKLIVSVRGIDKF